MYKVLETLNSNIIISKDLENYKSKFNAPYKDLFDNPLKEESDKVKLLETIAHINSLKQFYNHRNINDYIFYRTLKDLTYRANRYYSNNNQYGLSESDLYWLGFVFRGEMFDLGSLKFQRFKFLYQEIERSGTEKINLSQEYKDKFKEGTNIINIHILNNANLNSKEVSKTLNFANQFFKTHFSDFDYNYYVCRSWLLYPKLKEILSKDSNIVKFQNRFKIIATHNFPNQALMRIYSTDNVNEIESLDKITSLQKKHIKI